MLACLGGCSALPDVAHQPQLHNPFPQLHRVAILPFFNLSENPHVDQDRFAVAYFQELQNIPGFEVMPVGVVRAKLLERSIRLSDLNEATDYQALARSLGVDVVVRGAVTDYSPYYPPRLGLTVDWFAANPSFHPIPPGYGLPWGTAEEEYIPDALVREAEFALAREQLDTQTPPIPWELQNQLPVPYTREGKGVAPEAGPAGSASGPGAASPDSRWPLDGQSLAHRQPLRPEQDQDAAGTSDSAGKPAERRGPASEGADSDVKLEGLVPNLPVAAREANIGPLPAGWPDPSGLIPAPPRPVRPRPRPQNQPIITHTRHYDGHDEQFTERLANYFQFRDDARFGGWQSYLQRSDDFIRFCCHLHISETLAARGGAGKTRVVTRWPIGRYDR